MNGSVKLNGLHTALTPMWKLAEQAGMVFQNPGAQLLTDSVVQEIIFGLEQLGWSKRKIDARLEQVLTTFDLMPLRDRSPQKLSDGEKQKVALAAVMAREPAALILDEPLSMLDVTAEQDLLNEVGRVCGEGTAVVFFEHREARLRRIEDLKRLELNGRRSRTLLSPVPFPSGRIPPFRVQVRDVGVTLGATRVLDGIDVDFDGGELIAIVGRNGTGKTTFLRALTGLQTHDGCVTLTGEREGLDLGLVFQNPDLQLFNASVREEMLYRIPDPDLDWYRWLLRMLALEDYETTPPLLLSEGEKKRLGLGVVLMRRPRHGLLLDEPSLGQDGQHKATLIKVLRQLTEQGHLIIFTTHDLELAKQADRVLLLGEDGLTADGPADAIFSSRDLWEAVNLAVDVPDYDNPQKVNREGS